jgi:transposase-like protein
MTRQRFEESTKRQMIEDYLKGNQSKAEIWRRYTGQTEEHGKIIQWMRQFGYLEGTLVTGSVSLLNMPGNTQPPQSSVEELQKRIKQLEHQLLDSQLKEEAYRRMIDIAEKELKVSIRKKPNTK